MHGDLMMFYMTEPVADRIEPGDEPVNREEKIVPELGFERRLVAKFVARYAAEKIGEGAVDE